jgi:hypothetical protein
MPGTGREHSCVSTVGRSKACFEEMKDRLLSGNSIPALYEFCQWVSALNRKRIALDETRPRARITWSVRRTRSLSRWRASRCAANRFSIVATDREPLSALPYWDRVERPDEAQINLIHPAVAPQGVPIPHSASSWELGFRKQWR